MGGAEAILAKARQDYAKGNYRWVAEVVNRLIFAEPGNADARELQAQTLTQLGYQQVSASVRNVYLAAAQELRKGVSRIPGGARTPEYIGQMPPAMLLDYAGVALSPERAAGKHLLLNLDFGGPARTYRVAVEDGLLLYRSAAASDAAATVVLDNEAFSQVLNRRMTFEQALADGLVHVRGDKGQASDFFGLFDSFSPDFDIVTP
jgi:alkyl sulfatase BDS1-like metallo-beta-lactamase superfamily hydrolase